MKRILITGKNSYIGTSFEKWLEKYPEEYQVESVGTKNGEWKEVDFSQYDVIFHVAGLAHMKERKENQELYYKVNRDLPFEIAKKAKDEGIGHFIFLSSMSVYGMEKGIINKESNTNPISIYGKSKLQAENLIKTLENGTFKLTTLRPPMVYGKDCKGNYPRIAKLAVKTPIFPNIDNRRSMIYIDNLSEFVKQIIDNKSLGIFFPQNKEYINTTEMVKLIAEAHGKQLIVTKLFNYLIVKLNMNIFNKIFGSLVYDLNMSEYKIEYRVINFRDSIFRTEEY